MTNTFRIVLFGVGLLSASVAHAGELRCDGRPLARVDAAACAKAAEGPSALREFVWRTRAIYGLQMRDYVRFVGDEPKVQSAQPVRRDSVAGTAPTLR